MSAGAGPREPCSPTDAELAERVRRGDAGAFDVLVTRHMRRALSVAYRLLGHPQDAEDLVQEAFLAALTKIDTFRTDRDFRPWFYRILVNRGLDMRRARALRRTDEIPDGSPALSPSPLKTAEGSEIREHLSAAVSGLPERQRLIFQLYELEGFSGPEIAGMLDLPEGTARWHLHQARRALRAALVQHSRRQS